MHQDLGIREDPMTQSRQSLSRMPHLVENNLAWLHMGSRFFPSKSKNILESWQSNPKKFKLEVTRRARTPIIEEQKWAMIPQGGRESIEDVRVKAKGPIRNCNKKR
jgi:hypothetical protein